MADEVSREFPNQLPLEGEPTEPCARRTPPIVWIGGVSYILYTSIVNRQAQLQLSSVTWG